MQKRWSTTALAPSEEIIWWLAQVAFGLLLIVALYAFIDNSLSGGALAQRVYANDFGLLATIGAHSPDNIIVSQQVNKFKDTVFSISLKPGTVDVLANNLRNAGSMWLFTQQGVATVPGTLPTATGTVLMAKEDGTVSLLMQGGREWRWRLLNCPLVATKDAAGFEKTNAVVAPAGSALGTLADVLAARLGTKTLRVSDPMDPKLAAVDGIIITLQAKDTDRLVVYYPGSVPLANALRSEKLGCLMINAVLLDDALSQRLAGAAVAPTPVPYGLQPFALMVLPQSLVSQPTLQQALFKGVQDYYG
jgi:hypothetical protein